MRARRATDRPSLASPGVSFAPDYLARLGRLTVRLASLRERREGEGPARLLGVGAEFVGYRPYRSGEDLRSLDWNLLARLRRPFVRVAAREASERWCVLVDASASMGVGRPGKLQLAAETAIAIAAVGIERRVRVDLLISGRAERCPLRRRSGLAEGMRRLEESRAEGERGLASLAAEPGRFREAGRVFLLGDLLDCEPPALLGLARPSRELVLCQILAPEELEPGEEAAVRWIDAESAQARTLRVDVAVRASYERRLSSWLESWRAAAARARAAHRVWSSASPFESVVEALAG